MDLSAVLIIAAYSLVSAGSYSQEWNSTTAISSPDLNNCTACSCTNEPPATPTSSSSNFSLTLGILTVTWTNKCKGTVYLAPYLTFNSSSLPFCHSQEIQVQGILGNVCRNLRGCKGEPKWGSSSEEQEEGYKITEKGLNKTDCRTRQVKCKVEELPDFEGQLQTYKVVTALLTIVLLVLLLIRFTRPTVMALQKRLSDRRQNRWVGPTQSHSVSYHRGKSAVKNDDEEKRFSYPALERLTIGESSPSCNRNLYHF
ncbi:uncharacterized protein LOC124868053 isoform X1 [Girardinichthys multiradiatus]|uniref:uncharacterized protein LOC124868053 isoform X1 n=1 Tax=Girardinichthys multiradiatus TaxID=208333 RepID=UPI001FADF6F4|nr:uncharacterized protein LOC124868053 isoform X1 [Girardinichthys multiradiatus]